jgi:hypothetical protein
MASHIDHSNLSPAERLYREYMARGDDFMKIEIYRAARKWYVKALEMNIHNDAAGKKIGDCDRLIRGERKTISIVAAAAVCIILISVFIC